MLTSCYFENGKTKKIQKYPTFFVVQKKPLGKMQTKNALWIWKSVQLYSDSVSLPVVIKKKKKRPTLLAGNAELKSAVLKLLNGKDVIYGLK